MRSRVVNKGYFVVKKLVEKVRMKAFWYAKNIYGVF